MLSDLRNQALQNPDTTYPVDLASMCDLGTYRSSKSNSYNADIPASAAVCNTTTKENNNNNSIN